MIVADTSTNIASEPHLGADSHPNGSNMTRSTVTCGSAKQEDHQWKRGAPYHPPNERPPLTLIV
jgi:hypothetical protein